MFVEASAPGVHVGVDATASWLIARKRYRRQTLGLSKRQRPPDMSLDPESWLLSFINPDPIAKAFFVSVRGHACRGRDGSKLASAPSPTCTTEGKSAKSHKRVTTFVVSVAPKELVDVCFIVGLRSQSEADILSDIVELTETSAVDSPVCEPLGCELPSEPLVCEPCNALVVHFPLQGGQPYLCSQGVGGRLTHFAHRSTHHAIDLDAAIGTPVLAVADGTVHALRDGAPTGGHDVSLLFRYNALTLALDDGETTIEYVHIQAESARVTVGDRVTCGQLLCATGQAGFCPVPHLHLEAHRGGLRDATAASVPIAFACCTSMDASYTPVAGSWYDASIGRVPPPPPPPPAPAPAAPPPPGGLQRDADDPEDEDSDSGSSSGWETMSDED